MPDHERIAVDFDKTLTEGERSYIHEEPEDPDEEMVQWVNEQYAEDNTIIIWTARPWEAAQDTVARLTEWGVDWHGIRMEKGNADMYVDDKGTTPADELTKDGFDGDGELDGDETEGDTTDPERADEQSAESE
ncbi:hypothetical protein M0R88_08130 [Halorussus gelatinilyticus]|uniref:Capsular biosynthesis protein n=1 Tax=Halorussus gelatinilyticus TaxID=2937524 RepID=A0A8U0IPV8_9EURY|nr:hypothetical protein [Halorussus gelatinilyticus]UPW02049.1 hypothetical protein M0R88_08130 [Halorussus gelatinilyticus]